MNLHTWARRLRCSFVLGHLIKMKDDPFTLPSLKPLLNEVIELEIKHHMWSADVQA